MTDHKGAYGPCSSPTCLSCDCVDRHIADLQLDLVKMGATATTLGQQWLEASKRVPPIRVRVDWASGSGEYNGQKGILAGFADTACGQVVLVAMDDGAIRSFSLDNLRAEKD